ncbi:MAG: Nif3-like dinuclear metal center hexameric protein [Succinatimonas hippei]|nr:Nif3-like dinuclear metal center hexameric protein [Succinatimonas hippei]
MAADILDIVHECDRVLDAGAFNDVAYNGLQVEGRRACKRIMIACTASQRAIDSAIAGKADTILVHHGLMWKGNSQPYTGIYKKRLKALLEHDINLIAYHLPLDASKQYGNNAYLAQLLCGKDPEWVEPGNPQSIGMVCDLKEKLAPYEIGATLSTNLNCGVLVSQGVQKDVTRLGICSGSGSFLLDGECDFDMLITGDCTEQGWHIAQEKGIVLGVMGHDSSELGGVRLLGRYLKEKFKLELFSELYDPMQDTALALMNPSKR